MGTPGHSVIDRQRQLFGIVEEFFEGAAGENIASFSARGSFGEVIRARGSLLASRAMKAFPKFETDVRPLYSANWRQVFGDARHAGGMKLVLGGQSALGGTQVASIRKMLLYADTILIPDPILPWLEDERREEKFRHVKLIEASYWLLHLKPLVDAELPYPAILVFPSWEKGLERTDATTQERQFALTTAVVSHHINHPFASIDELRDYAYDHPEDLLSSIDSAGLFVAPGADVPEPLDAGLKRYREYLHTWRSAEHVTALEALPPGPFALNAIMERIGPQYHLIENSEELGAQPMMCLEAHWHYHKLIAAASAGRLIEAGALSPATIATLRALNRPTLSWLGNIPMMSLVELRRNNENERFRRKLEEFTGSLHAAPIEDIDRVAAEAGRGIASLIVDHQKEVERIASSYRLTHLRTLVGGIVTAAALFAPALAPFVGGLVAPVGLAGAYGYEKIRQLAEERRAARSLTGVLATANKTE